MEIGCNKCNKVFNVDDNLIPHNGRLVQCSNCKNEWFFKPTNIIAQTLSQDQNYDNDKITSYDEEKETLNFISKVSIILLVKNLYLYLLIYGISSGKRWGSLLC